MTALTESSTEAPLEKKLEDKLQSAKRELAKLDEPIYRLSVSGAVLVPVVLFTSALIVASVGSYYNGAGSSDLATVFASSSTVVNGIGLILLCRTLVTINRVSLLPPTLVDFLVTFPSGESIETASRSDTSLVSIQFRNIGSEVATGVEATVFVPDVFKILPGEYTEIDTTRTDFQAFRFIIGTIQPSSWLMGRLSIELPAPRGRHALRVNVYESKLGRTVHHLTLVIT